MVPSSPVFFMLCSGKSRNWLLLLVVSAFSVCSGFFPDNLYSSSNNNQQLQNLNVLSSPVTSSTSNHPSLYHYTSSMLSPEESSSNYWIPRDKLQYPFLVLSMGGEKEKIVNVFGVWCAFVSGITCPIWMLAMWLVEAYAKSRKDRDFDPNCALFDKTGKLWSKTWLHLTNSFPTQSGTLYDDGPCLYVANHASWLDIPVLCTVLEPVFKFIAKGELTQMPCIGKQLVGGKHILIDRDDRKSQLKSFKAGISWLKKGVPLMAFPEGTRSKSGRLADFKPGLFAMAIKTGVPIVPLTLSHTHAIFPPYALLPVQCGAKKLHVHVHDPIESFGRTEEELAELVRQAFLSTLPICQHPITKDSDNDKQKAIPAALVRPLVCDPK